MLPAASQKQNQTPSPSKKGEGFFFQPKLTINQPNDIYEQEADEVADKVMRMAASRNNSFFFQPKPLTVTPVQRKCAACEQEELLQREEKEEEQLVQLKPEKEFDVQRKCAHCEEDELQREKDKKEESPVLDNSVLKLSVQTKCRTCEEEEVQKKSVSRKENAPGVQVGTSNVEQALQSRGRQMDEQTQSFMERRFGYDFSNVQIHNDSLAHQSSADINALAYTYQNHIVFGEAQYQPATDTGKKLLAHELTHIIQQQEEHKIQRKQFGSPVLFDAKPVCPPTAEVQQSNVSDQDIAEELYGNPLVPVDRKDEYNINVDYAALRDDWKPYFKDCVPTEEATSGPVAATPAGPEFIAADKSYQLESHDIQGVSGIGIVARDKSPKLVLREAPSTSGKNLGALEFNTRFQIMDEPPGGWYHISTLDGRIGYVAKVYVKTNLPEPTAFLHRVEPGLPGTAIGIAEQYFHEDAAKWGMDLRFYVNAIAYINKIKIPDTYDGWKQVQFKAGNFIWIPGKEFAKSLKGLINTGSISYNVADALGVAQYIEGIVQKLEDYKNAIRLAGKYIPDAIIHHVKEGIVDALVSVAQALALAVGLLAVTTAIGAGIGALFGGVGAIPGAEIGFEVGMIILEWLGLAMLLKWIAEAFLDVASAFVKFLVAVWNANGNMAKLEEGAKLFAEAVGTLLGKLVEGIVMFAAAAGLGYAVGKLKSSKIGEKLGETRLFKWLKEKLGKKEAPEETKQEKPAAEISEGDLFEQQIKDEFAKKIIRENEPIYDEAGNQTGEIDFETSEALCEVGLSLDGKLPQLMREAELAKLRAKRLDVFYDVTRTPAGRLTAFKNSLGLRYGNRVRFIPKIYIPK